MGLIASVRTADLVRELTAVSKAASKRGTLPILYNVLIEAKPKLGLILSATDLTSRLQAFVPGNVTEKGSTSAPIADLLHLLGQFDKTGTADLVFAMDPAKGDRLLVTDTDGTSGSLRTIDPLEMPVRLDASKWDVVARLDAEVLSDLISRAIPFCADDQARPILTGVYVQTTADKITFGAADTYVVTGLDANVTNGVEANAVIPATALKLLLGTLGKSEATVAIRVKMGEAGDRGVWGTMVNFAFDQYDLTIAAIGGTFPNYEQVIPRYSPFDGETGSYGITVDRKAFLKALKLARKGDTIIHVVTGPGSVAVNIPDPDSFGKTIFAKSLPATVTPAQDVRIGFNPDLLTRVLTTITAPTVTLFRNDPGALVAFGVDFGDPLSRYAVMPTKLASLDWY